MAARGQIPSCSMRDTGATYATCDEIFDFNKQWDWIDGDVAGTQSNFYALQTGFSGFYSAASGADLLFCIHPELTYAFFSDGTHGYLFADYDGNHRADAGVELDNIHTTVNTLSWSDII